MASLCKTLRLSSPITKVELGYFGPDRLDSAEVEALCAQATLDGKSQAEEIHNAQILEFREELRALHDDVLGSLNQEFEALKNGIAEAFPRLTIALLKKTLPTVKIDADAIQQQIQDLVKQYAEDNQEGVSAQVSEEDFKLLCKAAGASTDAQEIKEGQIRISSNASLNSGDCQLETRFGLVDASIQTKIKHLEIALLGQ